MVQTVHSYNQLGGGVLGVTSYNPTDCIVDEVQNFSRRGRDKRLVEKAETEGPDGEVLKMKSNRRSCVSRE